MKSGKGLVVLGFGGHARSVADVALAAGFRSFLFVDVKARSGENFLGHAVCREFDGPLPRGWQCMPASGDARERRRQVDVVQNREWPMACLVAPTATIGVGARIGPGCLIGHHAHVGPMATVGIGCIINTGAIVEHECKIGDYCHVSVHAVVAGRGCLGSEVFLGAGATVIDGVSIAKGTIVGAGGVVCRNIARAGTYVGVPVQLIRKPVRQTGRKR